MYISPYCRLALVLPNFMKFGTRGHLINVITCQIFSQSVQGLRSSDTPKIAISHWRVVPGNDVFLLRRPYNSVRTAVLHCDNIPILESNCWWRHLTNTFRNIAVRNVRNSIYWIIPLICCVQNINISCKFKDLVLYLNTANMYFYCTDCNVPWKKLRGINYTFTI